MNLTDCLKIYIHAWELVLLYALIQTARWGRATRNDRYDHWRLASHRYYIGWMLYSVGFIVLGIVIARAFIPELNHWSRLLKIHLICCVAPFCAFLTLSLKINGSQHRKLHKFAAYPCIAATIGMLITGHLLASRLHGKFFPSGWLF